MKSVNLTFRTTVFWSIPVLCCLTTTTCSAQPSVHWVLHSLDRLNCYFDASKKMITEEEQAYFSDAEEYLKPLVVGVDKSRPIRMDFIMADGPERLRLWLPINEDDFTTFEKQNLIPNGINRKRRVTKNLHEFSGAFEGFMRTSFPYCGFASLRKDLPPGLNPLDKRDSILTDDSDFVFQAKNEGKSEELRNDFEDPKGIRERLMKSLIKGKREPIEDFELRKLWARQYLDEYERIYVEAKRFRVKVKLDPITKWIRATLELTPMVGTPLESSITHLSEAAFRFSMICHPEDAELSFRLSFILDQMRKDHFLNLFDFWIERELSFASRLPNKDERVARFDLIKHMSQLFEGIIREKKIDLFLDIESHGEKHLHLTGGFVVPESRQLLSILNCMDQRGICRVTLNSTEIEGVHFHTIAWEKDSGVWWQQLIGSKSMIVGAKNNAVWFATGDRRETKLKDRIRQSLTQKQGDTSQPVFSMRSQLGYWISWYGEHIPMDQSSTSLGLIREFISKSRSLVDEGSEERQTDLIVVVNRNANSLVGVVRISPQVLKLAGRILAELAKENISECAKCANAPERGNVGSRPLYDGFAVRAGGCADRFWRGTVRGAARGD